MKNIYPIFNATLSREHKERQLCQRGVTLWFTGLSGSGKSTIAIALERYLSSQGYITQLLDGDNIRYGINADLGFSQVDRDENIRRIAHICRLFTHSGIITLASFISPLISQRQRAKEIIGSSDFILIHISTPLEVCEQRDIKGLYAKARQEQIDNFTGISSPFEAPQRADIAIDTTQTTVEQAVMMIFNHIKQRIEYGVQLNTPQGIRV